MAGSSSARAVQLQCRWLCGAVVVPDSVDILPLDVRVYAREMNFNSFGMCSLVLEYDYSLAVTDDGYC